MAPHNRSDGGSLFFGHAVAVSPDGKWVAVGATDEGAVFDSGVPEGAVYLYSLLPDGGAPMVATLGATDVQGGHGGEFGYSLTFSPDSSLLVVGAPQAASPSGVAATGAFYLYRDQTDAGDGGWQPVPLAPGQPELPPFSLLGTSSAFGNPLDDQDSGTQMYIGASGQAAVPQTSGAVYSYLVRDSTLTEWPVVMGKQVGDRFGFSLAATPNGFLAVGAADATWDGGMPVVQGTVYTIDYRGTEPLLGGPTETPPKVTLISASTPGVGHLGFAVAFSPDSQQVYSGDPYFSSPVDGGISRQGGVAVLADDRVNAPVAEALGPVAQTMSQYGGALVHSAYALVVSAYGVDIGDASSAGAVFLYSPSPSVNSLGEAPMQTLLTGATNDELGYSLATTPDGLVLAVGAPGNANLQPTGRVYIYR